MPLEACLLDVWHTTIVLERNRAGEPIASTPGYVIKAKRAEGGSIICMKWTTAAVEALLNDPGEVTFTNGTVAQIHSIRHGRVWPHSSVELLCYDTSRLRSGNMITVRGLPFMGVVQFSG